MKKQEFTRNGGGDNYNYSQNHCFVKFSCYQTNGELNFVEDTLKQGFYLARHHHKIMKEVFYVLESVVELIFDDETIRAKASDSVTVPIDVQHACKCEKGEQLKKAH
tara:strand:- start:1881 stop:2201 length:321 start_codon:yes stop_codon:yes gene_type:complete